MIHRARLFIILPVLILLTGCATLTLEDELLVSKPSMSFSRNSVYSYSSRIMPQILPGLATSEGATPSTCTVCR